ncbi:hypothetical protein PSTU1396_22625 (plasmid) [Providencia stuartii]|nr:hypothetical protein PSTU1396_22625 [Providencia stuartii]CAK6619534.1 hypothetical protein PS9952019_22655 [Providencia stuartii]
MAPHRPADPHQFVRQGHGSLVVADAFGRLQGPALQLGQALRRTCLAALGGQQRRAGAVDQQRSHVNIALAADAAELAALAAAVFVGCHAQPGAQMPAAGEAFGRADSRFQGAGGEQPDAADLVEPVHDLVVGMPARQLLLALAHRLFVETDLGQQYLQRAAQGADFRTLDQLAGLTQERLGAVGRGHAHLAQDAAQQVDALDAGLLPGLAHFVQLLHLLLLHAFDRHRTDALATSRLQDRIAVVAIGLTAPPVGAHVARMQQHHAMPRRLHQPAPVVSRAAGLHHPLDRLRLLLYITPECLRIEPPATIHPTDMDTFGNLVNGLGQINCNAFHLHSPGKQTPRVL